MDGTDPTATHASPETADTPRAQDVACVTGETATLAPGEIADAAAARAETYARATTPGGVCVCDGVGLRVRVDRGALVVEDGMGAQRRVRRFHKATHGLARVVVFASHGAVTLDALAWCRRLGIAVTVHTPDGVCVLASTPRVTDDARLRRTQALAPDLPVGLDLARWLLTAKVTGQAALLATRFDGASGTADTIAELVDAITDAESIDECRQLEAAAAALYFTAWTARPECAPRFAARDRARIPDHWTRYEGRRSVLASTNSNRKAERPTNTLLNYLYAILETEATLACAAVGLDPGLGIIHADTRTRASLALDLIEPARPAVDAYVLDLLEQRTFRKADFVETDDGHVRLRSPLTHDLAETLPHWTRAIAPTAEHVAHQLGDALAGRYNPTTPLTRRRTRTAQAIVKARKTTMTNIAASHTKPQRPKPSTAATGAPVWTCPDCGAPVLDHRHVRCDTCIANDPRQTPTLRGRRGQAIAARKRALREWEAAHPNTSYDPGYFARELLPRLPQVTLPAIVAATGLSKSYASQIRSGEHTPHIATWDALAKLLGVPPPTDQNHTAETTSL